MILLSPQSISQFLSPEENLSELPVNKLRGLEECVASGDRVSEYNLNVGISEYYLYHFFLIY